ncbi:hypothetical protein [Aurantiacibacter suaedae]|uniref:hypothetical protein n=1 Tax=Aurantiacibacter suaedae TaxID=2545755 RepID=UPI001386E3BA|nr:hypothetical protein [Aurantiacibacter suaedae]
MRLLLPLVALALLVAVAGVSGYVIDWRAWFDGPERGTWRAQEIGGIDVRADRMWIVVREGEVRGGRDGCNYWSYEGAPDPRTGERMMTSTLALCEETPVRRAYARLARGSSTMALLSDDLLEVRAFGVIGRFVRWTEEMERAEREADERAIEAARAAGPPAASPGVYTRSDTIPRPPLPPPPPPPAVVPPPPPPAPDRMR